MSVSLLASVVRNMTENRVWASQSSEANFVCTLWARAQSRSLKKYDTTDSLYYLSRVSQCLTLHITHIYRLGQAWVPFQTNYMLRFQSWPWYCVFAKYRPQCNEKASSDTWRPCHSKNEAKLYYANNRASRLSFFKASFYQPLLCSSSCLWDMTQGQGSASDLLL